MSTQAQRLKLNRLPGISLAHVESLWMEQDHLIVCTGYGLFLPFLEEYRRFFFRDIQGIQISINQRRHTVTVILVILTFLVLCSLLLAALAGKSWLGLTVFLGVAAVFLLAALVLNLSRGPTCTVIMKTAVQTVRLKSVTRLPAAERLLFLLQPLIEKEQSDLPSLPPQQPAALSSPTSTLPSRTATSPPIAPPPAPPPHDTNLFWHWLTGGLMLTWTVLALADYFSQLVWISLIRILVLFALLLTPIVALIRQRQGKSPAAFAVISWLGLAFSLILLLSGYAALISIQFKDPELAGDQWKMLKYYAELAPGADSLVTVLTALEVILSTSLGLVYLGFTFKEKFRRKNPPATGQP